VGQEQHVGRVTGAARQVGGGDQVDRVGGPGVLGQAVVVVVGQTGVGIVGDVLQDRPEVVGRRVDLGLGVLRDADGLGVAAALEVEHALVAPAVLVVADQATRRVGGERRLAGAGQAEEQGHVAVGAHVGRAVHGQGAPGGQQVV